MCRQFVLSLFCMIRHKQHSISDFFEQGKMVDMLKLVVESVSRHIDVYCVQK